MKRSQFSQVKRFNVVVEISSLIQGKIKLEFLRELIDGMVEDGKADWVGKGPRVQALLYWLKPEEWANMISNWVCRGIFLSLILD